MLLETALSVVSVAEEVTFHKDIEPILQRSCQNCHREGGVGPMPLVTFDQVAPFAGLIEYKTGLRDRAGAMPPWYMEKNIGIQGYKNDPSLSDGKSLQYRLGLEMEHLKEILCTLSEPLVLMIV